MITCRGLNMAKHLIVELEAVLLGREKEKNDSFYLLNLNSISFLFQEMMKAKHNI